MEIAESDLAHSEEELRMILEASQEGGHIDEVEQILMRRALTFGDRTVSDIMVPRTETAFLPTSNTVSEAIAEVEEPNHTRYPVFEEDVDITPVPTAPGPTTNPTDNQQAVAYLEFPAALFPNRPYAFFFRRRESLRRLRGDIPGQF